MRELSKCILKTVFKWGAEEGMENIVKDCFQMLFFLQLCFIPFRGTPCVTFYFDGIIMESDYIFNKCVNLYSSSITTGRIYIFRRLPVTLGRWQIAY